MCENIELINWVEEIRKLVNPEKVIWIDGTEEQKTILQKEAIKSGDIHELSKEKLPGCFYHRSNENDVARVEDLTFICTEDKEDVGPTNNWMNDKEAYEKLKKLFSGIMKQRTMYVIPYLMGPIDSKFSKVGVEITDSIYVVLNMLIMTKVGKVALDYLDRGNEFVRCLHSKGNLNPQERFICHFPKDNTIWSFGSAYGGNALLSKKCFALRIASFMGKNEGWLAEHMLILGIQNPIGETSYIAAAFPSACGKTNLAMVNPPKALNGYRIWTVGDDIAWLRIGEDGRIWAVNPENGFFGVAPGTNEKTNPNIMKTISKNTIFTNVVLTDENTVWWEGLDKESFKSGTNWRGKEWSLESSEKGAHPNARFTAPIEQCPSLSLEWKNPKGVPISAFIFGGRRESTIPLVYEAFDWEHGVFLGATMSSETTAAATGKTGVVRRDPMAMLPFCGYNMGEYFAHWINMGKRLKKLPKIFNVNWFRKNEMGEYIWPGYSENVRILDWIIKRCNNEVGAQKSEIGYLPYISDINIEGLDIQAESMRKLFEINKENWEKELEDQKEFFLKFGDGLPNELWSEYEFLKDNIK